MKKGALQEKAKMIMQCQTEILRELVSSTSITSIFSSIRHSVFELYTTILSLQTLYSQCQLARELNTVCSAERRKQHQQGKENKAKATLESQYSQSKLMLDHDQNPRIGENNNGAKKLRSNWKEEKKMKMMMKNN